ncbi:MAG: metallophosphoesterase [Clostridia bacterium]|nr:metallophosphoesterase [Clostridia bacterium]
MKIKRLLSWVMAVVLLIGLMPTAALSGAAANPAVVLRFLVASDTHLTENANDIQALRLKGMFESATRYAQTQDYTNIDAAILLGDIVCLGNPQEYASVKSALDSAVPAGTDVLTLMGNHEWWLYSNNGLTEMGSHSYLEGIAGIDSITEKGLRWSTDINGYHFVGISPISYENYSVDDIEWAGGEIAEAVAADSTKPVFMFQHHPIKNTVMGSFGASAAVESDLMNEMYDYRQVIHFSGHSHISVNTPTAINQTTYTQYTTGTMATLGADGNATYNGVLPGRDNVAQYTIVEVTEDHGVRMIPYDQYTDSRFASLNGDGTDIEYTVDVNDPDNWLYKPETRADRTEAPAFAFGASATVSGVTHESFTISFPQATDNDGMYGYDIVCDDGNTPLTYRIYSEWYFQPMPATLTYEVRELAAETAYTVTVYPLDFFGNKGEGITCAVTTETAPVEEEEIVLDPSAYTTNLVPYGNAESGSSTNWGLFKNTTFSAEQVHAGNYSLKLHNTGTQAQVQVNLRGIVPNNEYRISLWVYTDTGVTQPTIQRSLIAAVESPWKTLDSVYGTVTRTAGQWTQYTYTYTAPAKTNLFQISFYTADVNTYFYLDDLEIYRVCSHKYTTHTEATDDQVELWTCRTCGKAFTDEACTEEYNPSEPPVEEPDDNSILIDFDVDTDIVAAVGYNSTEARTYLEIQTAQTLPVINWAGYSGTTTVAFDKTSVTCCAAGLSNPNRFQIYTTGDTTNFATTATEITIPAGTTFTKNDVVVRFPKDFTIEKKNGAWVKKKAAVVPTDHGGDTELPDNVLSAGVSNGDFNKTTGQNFNGDCKIENGLGVLPASGTDDYIQFNGVTVTAGVEYTLAFYVWVTEASAGFEFNLFFFGAGSPKGEWLDFALGSGYVTSNLSAGINTTMSGWQRVTVTWTAPASGDAVFGMKNYGSTATGMVYVDDVSLTYPQPTDTETTFEAYNVTLASDIRIGVKVSPADGVELADLTLYYTLDGVEQTATLTDELFYCDVAAKDMTSTVSMRLVDSRSEEELATASTTLRAYAEELLTGDYSAAVKNAARAMLCYGAAAQTYFDCHTDRLADVGYAYTQTELDAADPGEASGVDISGGTPTGYLGATLLLRSKVGIRLYFEENIGGALTYSDANDLYYYEFAEIGAAALSTAQSVTLDGTTYETSVLSLAHRVIESEAYDTAFKNLMKTLVLYHDAALAL